eukprot:CAMPEP_0170481782 /NCGR_PEP_ID=MMETSP0208-20121228/2094_1 /TAXON_ID=197538 /ORGANISM="Strombidium inclinatum, Strain S3" /LENGTH=222 /DNA_ID=CAMNT_0010754547 /DNA_START=210 /DNA_END=879 /DNA_ORIENTATION=+
MPGSSPPVEVRQQVEDVLQVLHDLWVVPVLSAGHLLEVQAHLAKLTRQGLHSVYFIDNLLAQLALGSVLDVSQKVLHSDLFGLRRRNGGGRMNELAVDIAVIVGFLLGEVGLGGQANVLLVLHADHDEAGVGVVVADDLINFYVVLADVGARRVPAHDLLLRINFAHHPEHLLVVDVVEEPDLGVLLILFERNGEAVGHFQNAVVAVLAHEGSDHSLLGVLS